MSNIGSETFISMSGPDVPLLAAAVEIIDRPGLDGIASRVDALKATELTIYTIQKVVDVDTANDKADDYADLKGTKVTVEDDLGRSVASVLIVDVRVTKKQQVLVSSPTGTGALVWAVWLLKPTAAS